MTSDGFSSRLWTSEAAAKSLDRPEDEATVPVHHCVINTQRTFFHIMQLSYARKSVLAGAWYVASQSRLHQSEVCLCGENMVEECQIRQWVGFYTSRVKLETDWDTLSRDALAAVLEVRKISGAVTVVARGCVQLHVPLKECCSLQKKCRICTLLPLMAHGYEIS